MNITITLEDHSPEVLAAFENACERALQACGIKGSDYAKEKAPADTGHLKRMMESTVQGDTAYIGTNVEYAIYQEIGTGIYASMGGGRQTPWAYPKADGGWGFTRGSRPHHMVRDAVADHVGEYEQIIVESLHNA